jgi:delta 1-pyrroline-5-carboxylate dehydrogenase
MVSLTVFMSATSRKIWLPGWPLTLILLSCAGWTFSVFAFTERAYNQKRVQRKRRRLYSGLGLYIDGAWRGGAKRRVHPVIDPSTERQLGDVPVAETSDVEMAIAAAEKARHNWAKTDSWRARVIHKIADLIRERQDEVSRMAVLELGRPPKHVVGEIALSADQFEWFAEETKRI